MFPYTHIKATNDYHTPDSILNADSIPTTGTLCIIAGSRSATDILTDSALQTLINSAITDADFTPDTVISGTANGVDEAGENWATNNNIPVAQFPAPWDDTNRSDAVVRDGKYGTYDANAGPRRNRWMADYAHHHADRGVLLAIIDYPSSGTESMIQLARDTLGDNNVFVLPIGDNTDDAKAEFSDVLLTR